MPVRDKHSSLLWTFVNFVNRFKTLGPAWNGLSKTNFCLLRGKASVTKKQKFYNTDPQEVRASGVVAFCPYCNIDLDPRVVRLRQHEKTSKHRRNAEVHSKRVMDEEVRGHTNLPQIVRWYTSWPKSENANWMRRLSTVDLLIKLACFVKKILFVFSKPVDINWLVQGGQPYWVFPLGRVPCQNCYKIEQPD